MDCLKLIEVWSEDSFKLCWKERNGTKMFLLELQDSKLNSYDMNTKSKKIRWVKLKEERNGSSMKQWMQF